MMQYVAALYDHLVRSNAIDLTDGLPPVLPIVLYNGDTRWNHSPELLGLNRVMAVIFLVERMGENLEAVKQAAGPASARSG